MLIPLLPYGNYLARRRAIRKQKDVNLAVR